MKKPAVKRARKVVDRFPPGWDQARVQKVIDYYDHQSDEEAIAEAEAALARQKQTVMNVPIALVPVVRVLIAQHKRAREARK